MQHTERWRKFWKSEQVTGNVINYLNPDYRFSEFNAKERRGLERVKNTDREVVK